MLRQENKELTKLVTKFPDKDFSTPKSLADFIFDALSKADFEHAELALASIESRENGTITPQIKNEYFTEIWNSIFKYCDVIAEKFDVEKDKNVYQPSLPNELFKLDEFIAHTYIARTPDRIKLSEGYESAHFKLNNTLIQFAQLPKKTFPSWITPFKITHKVISNIAAYGYKIPEQYWQIYSKLCLQNLHNRERIRKIKECMQTDFTMQYRVNPKMKIIKLVEECENSLYSNNAAETDLKKILTKKPNKEKLLEAVRLVLFHREFSEGWAKEFYHKLNIATTIEEVILAIYEEFNKNIYDIEYKNFQANLLAILMVLPKELTGIENETLPWDHNEFLFKGNGRLEYYDVEKFNSTKAIVLTSLRKKLPTSNIYQIARPFKITSTKSYINISMATEQYLLRSWKGVADFIFKNIKSGDLTQHDSTIDTLREKIERAREEKDYDDFILTIIDMKSMINHSDLNKMLNKFIGEMQSGNIPSDDSYQSIENIFKLRIEFSQLLDEVRISYNKIVDEFKSWNAQTWAPLRNNVIRKKLKNLFQVYTQLEKCKEAIENGTSKDSTKLDELKALAKRINDFPQTDAHFCLLREEQAAHTSESNKKADRIHTYFHVLSPKDRTAEATFDHIRILFLNEITKISVQRPSEKYNLFTSIRDAKSINEIYMLIYEQLASSETSMQMQEILIATIKSLPESETGITSNTTNILEQLRQKLGDEQHNIELDGKTITLSLSKEDYLFNRWKGIALTISKNLKSSDFGRMSRFFSNVNISDIQNRIATSKSYSQLFSILSNLKKQCTNNRDLKNYLDIARKEMLSGLEPTIETFEYLLEKLKIEPATTVIGRVQDIVKPVFLTDEQKRENVLLIFQYILSGTINISKLANLKLDELEFFVNELLIQCNNGSLSIEEMNYLTYAALTSLDAKINKTNSELPDRLLMLRQALFIKHAQTIAIFTKEKVVASAPPLPQEEKNVFANYPALSALAMGAPIPLPTIETPAGVRSNLSFFTPIEPAQATKKAVAANAPTPVPITKGKERPLNNTPKNPGLQQPSAAKPEEDIWETLKSLTVLDTPLLDIPVPTQQAVALKAQRA